MPDWSEPELEELGYGLQQYARRHLQLREEVRDLIAWPRLILTMRRGPF
jgi:hypothetical protein